ncbi:MAG TPA: nuclear transport factor 2 family protein, partial [Thermomonas sp.]|nr:nuclear transport factor 2 family protein [Thermomonas sp.]
MQQFRGFQGIARLGYVGLLLVLAACSRSDPEQAVRAQVDALQQAIDARDAGAVEDLLAEDFIGNEGMDRRGAKQLAAGVFLRHREIGARLGPVTVELRGEREAIARFSVLATGGSGGLLPEQGQVYQVQTGWRLQDGD